MSAKLNPEQVAELLTTDIVIESGRRMLLKGDEMPFSLAELTDLANLVLERERAAIAQAAPSDEAWRKIIAATARLVEMGFENDDEREAVLVQTRKIAAAITIAPSSQAAPAWNGEGAIILSGSEAELMKIIEQLSAQIASIKSQAAPDAKNLPIMSGAFRTTRSMPRDSGLSDYQMVFQFTSLKQLDDADDEWRNRAAPSQAAPSTSIDKPAFWHLVNAYGKLFYDGSSDGGASASRALIAYIDPLLARPAPATEPAPDAAPTED